MKLHVLPGDAIVETFNAADIDGEIAVCRECLIEGDVSGETLAAFWKKRAEFLASANGETDARYMANVAGELEKLTALSTEDSVFLWFEYELFCQVNYWFCLDLLEGSSADVFRVVPIVRDEASKWQGFGRLSAEDLKTSFAARVQLTSDDTRLGSELWQAYRTHEWDELRRLSETASSAFPMLKETAEAAIAKDERPQAILREILEEGTSGFEEIFEKFSARAGVYGFGDSQVRRILENL